MIVLTVILVLGILLLLATGAELAARTLIRRGGRYYVFPPGLRIRLHPDQILFPQLEPVVRFEINGEGERGGELPRLRPGETLYRVLVAGGSQPEGYMLDQDTSWPGALQRLLEEPDALRKVGASRVHVGSIARSGVGSEALGLVLERVLPRYPRLHAIIILVGASDVLTWLEQGAPAAPPTPPRVPDVFRCHPEGPFDWRPRELALVESLRRLRRRWLRPVQVHERAGRWIGEARAMRARATEIRHAVSDPTPMLDHFESCLRRALRLAAAQADRLLLVRQPWFEKEFSPAEAAHMWHGGAGQVWREEVTAYYSHEVLAGLMAQLDARAARVADALGVEHLDLMPLLVRSLATYYDFFHLTPAGARVNAAAVATALLRRPVASVPTKTAHQTASREEQRPRVQKVS